MGADFNILEYADPELGDIGEKTNILDENLDLEEPDVKKESTQQVKTESTETDSSAPEHTPVNPSSVSNQQNSATPVSAPHQTQVSAASHLVWSGAQSCFILI